MEDIHPGLSTEGTGKITHVLHSPWKGPLHTLKAAACGSGFLPSTYLVLTVILPMLPEMGSWSHQQKEFKDAHKSG